MNPTIPEAPGSQDMGVAPAGPGHQPAASAADASSRSGVPNANALVIVGVQLSRRTEREIQTSMTLSWLVGTREAALAKALEYARKVKPDFSIDQWIVDEIPASAIEARQGTDPEEGLDAKHESAASRSEETPK